MGSITKEQAAQEMLAEKHATKANLHERVTQEILDQVEENGRPLFTPLDPDLEYVDATEFQVAMTLRIREQEQLITKLMMALDRTQNGLLATQKSLIRAHEAIQTLTNLNKGKGALILPDRLVN